MKIRLINYKKSFPNAVSDGAFRQWFSIDRYWNGKILQITVKHFSISFDFSKDWVSDMTFGKMSLGDKKNI